MRAPLHILVLVSLERVGLQVLEFATSIVLGVLSLAMKMP